MTRQTKPKSEAREVWKWRLDLGLYDCGPQLTATERDEIERLAGQKNPTSIFDANHELIPLPRNAILHRLLRPIHDAWKVAGVTGKDCGDALAVLYREIHCHQSAYWAWSHAEWFEIVGTSRSKFYERHGWCRSNRKSRRIMLLTGYLLCGFADPRSLTGTRLPSFAAWAFGKEPVEMAIRRVCDELAAWGYTEHRRLHRFPNTLALLLLANRSPHLEDLSDAAVAAVMDAPISGNYKYDLFAISRVLAKLGFIRRPLEQLFNQDKRQRYEDKLDGVPLKWAHWAKRWRDTSTLESRQGLYMSVIRAARWVAEVYPHKGSPRDWTRDTAIAYVAAVDRMLIGEWVYSGARHHPNLGKPLSAETKAKQLSAIRTFFRDCQEWGWFPRLFDPLRCFATPRSVRALIGPDPRVIADDIWAKLLWAGLNLTESDVPSSNFLPGRPPDAHASFYPVELVRAVAIVWLFSGLRSDELRRLRVGCVRWQREDVTVPLTGEVLPKDAVCWLDVPVHKTGTPFTKAVDRVVGEAIEQWQGVRPPNQPPTVDRKTAEVVYLLFSYRGKSISAGYVNGTVVPLLCRKAGVPRADARGTITSHRARSTIASQLFNAKEPLTLFELQEWLGHRLLSSTQHYAKKSPLQVAKSYEKAGYFGRNVRTVAVLLDQDAIKSGAAANGQPWRYYDLGHGYCTYEFFDQCAHRMACAKCSFYLPKASSGGQLLEGKNNLLQMLQEIPLTDEEVAAVEEGVAAYNKLLSKLSDVPTPTGYTPRQVQNYVSQEHN